MTEITSTPKLVTVFGGSGFVGRHVVRALAKRGYQVRVACRRPNLAFHLQPLGNVGQIHAVQANLRNRASVDRAVAGADHVINLVAIMNESGKQTYNAVQVFGARAVAEAARAAGAGLTPGTRVGALLGLTGIPVVNIDNASASGSSAFRSACLDVASGRVDVAVAVGVAGPHVGREDGKLRGDRRVVPQNEAR